MPRTGPEAAKEGAIEDLKGMAKEFVGKASGDEGLEREGEAQQGKAAAARDVAKKEAEAEKSRGEYEAEKARLRPRVCRTA